MRKRLTPTIFWFLAVSSLLVIGEFFVPAFRNLLRSSFLFLFPIIIFSLLGLALIIATLKEKIGGRIKKFLILTGASATGFFISIFLHNAVYGLFIYFFGSDFWLRIGLKDEPLFFLIAIIFCPIGFLVGTVGTIMLFIKEKRGGRENNFNN